MNRRKIQVISTLAVLAGLLAACASTPTHFYTLVRPAAAVAAATSPSAPFMIEVPPVTVPSQVDVPQIVVREGGGEMALAESNQWVSPLPEEFRSALVAELVARTGAQEVYRLPRPADAKLFRIQVAVRRFDSSLGKRTELEAQWTITGAAGFALSCSTRDSESVGEGYGSLVEGHQRAVSALADQITAALSHAGGPACPR
jgi:uncharacterized lipoprotein YmbA